MILWECQCCGHTNNDEIDELGHGICIECGALSTVPEFKTDKDEEITSLLNKFTVAIHRDEEERALELYNQLLEVIPPDCYVKQFIDYEMNGF